MSFAPSRWTFKMRIRPEDPSERMKVRLMRVSQAWCSTTVFVAPLPSTPGRPRADTAIGTGVEVASERLGLPGSLKGSCVFTSSALITKWNPHHVPRRGREMG